MPGSEQQAGRDRARDAVASYERERDFWRDREAQLLAEHAEAIEDEDDKRCQAIEAGLSGARYEALRAGREVETFRRMAERGWQPPHPRSPEVLDHAAALRWANRRPGQVTSRAPERRDRALGERRPRGRRRSSRRSGRAGPSDPDDPDPPGDLTPPAGGETAGAAR